MNAEESGFDLRELRKALGSFVTGVTVVTTLEPNGEPRGFTANSFTSVSLDPPLILVCLGRSAASYPVFAATGSFAVNILSDQQRAVSGIFASKNSDKFADVPWRPGRSGNPLLEGGAAWLDCKVHDRIEAGDHIVLIGWVVAFGHSARPPLGYYAGNYLNFGLEKHAMDAVQDEQSEVGGVFEKDGSILLLQNGHEFTLPCARTLGEDRAQRGSLFALLRERGVKARVTFVYAVAHERGTDRLHIYYRGEILEGPAPEEKTARLVPFEEIPWDALPTRPSHQNILRRYVEERSEDRFGIYFGNVGAGAVAKLVESR